MHTIELGVEVTNGLTSGTSRGADFRSVRRHEQMVCISDLINVRILAPSVGQFPQILSEMYEKKLSVRILERERPLESFPSQRDQREVLSIPPSYCMRHLPNDFAYCYYRR